MSKTLSLALMGSVAAIALVQPAMALDAQAFADRLSSVYGKIGYEITVSDAKLKGDTIVLDGVKFGLTGMEIPADFALSMTFTGVTEEADGGYRAAAMTIPDIDYAIEETVPGHISLTDVVVEDIYLPGGDEIGAISLLQLIGSVHTGPLTVTRGGEDLASIDSMAIDYTFVPEQGSPDLESLSSVFSINGIALDLTSVAEEDAQAGAVIEGLGLTTINGDVNQTFNWTMADGRMVMDQFLIDFADLGSLDVTMDMAGFTPAVLDQLYAMQAKMLAEGTDPASEEAQAQQMMAGMQMAQSITLSSVKVRYDDNSLAGTLLDFFAQSQGVDRAQFVAGIKAALPGVIAGTGVPALTDLLAAPVGNFLDDPQSFEIAVQPASPTTLLVLTAAAANPAGLISALGLKATANEAAAE